MYTSVDIDRIIKNPENEVLEFKEAQNNFSLRDRADYCAGLANSGGGRLLLGVADSGDVVGTNVYRGTINTIPQEVHQGIGIWVSVQEVLHPKGRIVIFDIPSRSEGRIIRSTGSYRYPIRKGESLVEMDHNEIRSIMLEVDSDFSAQTVPDFSLKDVDKDAIQLLKNLWASHSRREEYASCPDGKALQSLELADASGNLNYAALILVGKKEKIDALLPSSEIIYEWRQRPGQTPHDSRISWREPFMKAYDEIWNSINDRNLRMPFQEGFIQREVFAFTEKPVREAVLNAVAHRDYRMPDRSIVMHVSPEEFIIESPGGLPQGVTVENILDMMSWRNRRIMEVFEKIGLVERSGQGMDDIFQFTIEEGKGLPDLSETNATRVKLKIPAQVQDEQFILYLEKIANEKQISFSLGELYALEAVRRESRLEDKKLRDRFFKLGIIEKIGKTSDAKYILSHKYYKSVGKLGTHTRLRGLSREVKKRMILEHLHKETRGTSEEFQEALNMRQQEINNLLQELKRENKVEHRGARRSGYWVVRSN